VNVIEGRFDRRATHRIFSEPVALDLVNDLTALASEGIRYLEAAHWLALGTGDEQLVRGINVGHDRLVAIRELTHNAAALVEASIPVDPYGAVQYAGLEVA
jgi:hypothetical protein